MAYALGVVVVCKNQGIGQVPDGWQAACVRVHTIAVQTRGDGGWREENQPNVPTQLQDGMATILQIHSRLRLRLPALSLP